MRGCFAAAFAALLAAAAPARAQPAEQGTIAIPAFSFAFSLEYLAEDIVSLREATASGSLRATSPGWARSTR